MIVTDNFDSYSLQFASRISKLTINNPKTKTKIIATLLLHKSRIGKPNAINRTSGIQNTIQISLSTTL